MISNTFSLPDIDFVGGASEKLMFHVYTGKVNPRPFDVDGCTANFAIVNSASRYTEPLVSKSMSATVIDEAEGCNVLIAELAPGDTLDLVGKFIYQITIKDDSDHVEAPQQGVIYIHNNINKEFLRVQGG